MGLDEIRKIKEQKGQPKPPKNPLKRKSPIKKSKPKGVSGGAELNRWFEERRLEMTGICKNCGKRTCATDDFYYKFSIAHILPKAYFKSVKTHPDNWIEVCFWGENSCHTNMDNNTLDMIEMNCWDEIVVKFQRIYPMIKKDERKRIPDTLKQYINTDL